MAVLCLLSRSIFDVDMALVAKAAIEKLTAFLSSMIEISYDPLVFFAKFLAISRVNGEAFRGDPFGEVLPVDDIMVSFS